MKLSISHSAAILFAAAAVSHAEPARRTKRADPTDIPTLMAARGKLLLDEPFKTTGWSKNLKPYKGDFQLVDDQLKVAPEAGANHPPQASFYAPMKDVVVQVRFRLDGAKRVSVMLSSPERSENIASVNIDSKQVSICRMSGWGGTTKVAALASKAFEADDDWHTLLVEWSGSECLIQLDGKLTLFAETPELNVTKGQFSLQSGGEFAWYDDLRIWEAAADPTWEKRKSKVTAAAERTR